MNSVTPINSYPETKNNASRYVNHAVSSCFIAPICLLVISKVAYGKFTLPLAPVRGQSDYMLMIVQCTLGMAIVRLPGYLGRLLRIAVPEFIKILFSSYLFCAVFLGEVFNFYQIIPFWDSIMHLCSGVMLGFLGCLVFDYINFRSGILQARSPMLMALFAFCFSLAAGAVWELYEFGIDAVMDLNMQKTVLPNGVVLSGHIALVDTIKDIFLDTVGAFIAARISYSALKNGKAWIIENMIKPELPNEKEGTKSLAA